MNTITTQSVDPTLLSTMNGGSSTKSAAQAAQDRFMTLLVTQMKNQDPLNPLDNAQVTSQLAQLSTVTGIDKLNETVSAMSGNFQSSQGLQAANMIGHGVVVPGNNVELKDGKSVFGFDLPQSADAVRVQIKDVSGSVVRTLTSNNMSAGMNSMTWDGKNDSGTLLGNGNYEFVVDASSGDKKLTTTSLSFGMVSSVTFGKQGAQLSISNVGDVAMADVRQVF
ncbi:flagellar hook assembly protein FlgD [Undibacterium sp. LX40W]|uniref:Basal-body rod modification protein FlgD n=1 Tax=Undibacterium nitidum TaxID=2762298 RepID=A0A923HN52_9BURK|nr:MULTISPECIES: flagellar hook assembly protein FlgD [Undibacterium]MBC3880145.1 flagellar hook assembly protein FlgD [Undibacterium nitidum]MBC3891119.1 flagellar hook assembly protein FlgD [Undibacterium sp. LX40W]